MSVFTLYIYLHCIVVLVVVTDTELEGQYAVNNNMGGRVFVIRLYWAQNPSIVIHYCFKINSLIRYEIQQVLIRNM